MTPRPAGTVLAGLSFFARLPHSLPGLVFSPASERSPLTVKAFQDYYPDDVSHCYGCGRLNPHGLQIKSFWDREESVCRFEPRPYHTAIPGYVYGGLIASLIDCHATGTAAAAKYREEGRELGTEPPVRFVTGSLRVDYLAPTPINDVLELRGRVTQIKDRKVTVEVSLSAKGTVCARGTVVTVQMPADWIDKLKAASAQQTAEN
jgi:acyl-coenzyme A thioesterase PaaI-like protein